MADKEKNVGKANGEHNGPDLLIWHDPFDWTDKKGKKHHTKGHWEVNPQLSVSRKKEAPKLKAEKQPDKAAPARKAAKETKAPKLAEGASPDLVRMAKETAKEAARDAAAPTAAVGERDA